MLPAIRTLFGSNKWIFIGLLFIQALYCMFLLDHYQRFRKCNVVGLQKSSWFFTSAVPINDDQYPTVTSSDNEQQSINSLNISNHVAISQEFFRYLVSHLQNTTYPGVQSYAEYTLAQEPKRSRKVVNRKPLRVDFGPVVNDVKSFRYPIDIPPCRDAVDSRSAATAVNLFVVIISAPSNFEKRNVIRQTWLRQFQPNQQLSSSSSVKLTVNMVGHGFVMGLPSDLDNQMRVEGESAMHGDILQIDMIDTYSNLTRKLVGTLNWIDDHCSQVDFVLKVDDDVYVNIRNLISAIRSLNSSIQSVYGTAADGLVRREGKFNVSLEKWPWSSYPVYTMGAFQLIAGCTIKSLLAAAQATPYFPFEDTFMGLCAEKAGVKIRFSSRALGYFPNSPHPCQVHEYISWLTDSASVIVKSHRATDDFYTNVTQCFITKQGQYIEPSKTGE